MSEHEHILVVFPHPDDEVFGCSGTLARYRSKGVPVTYICLTLGEMGRNMGKPRFATRESLAAFRKKELEAACLAVGIEDLRMFGLRDKTIEFEDHEALAERIRGVIDEIQPSLIITHYPGYAVHPDHDATGEVVVRAVKSLPPEKRPTVYGHAFAKNTIADLGEPDVVHDVSDFLDAKVAAMGAHKSQFHQAYKEMTEKPEARERIAKERFWTIKI